MIRPATRADIPRVFEIRDSVGENRLADPSAVTEAEWSKNFQVGTIGGRIHPP